MGILKRAPRTTREGTRRTHDGRRERKRAGPSVLRPKRRDGVRRLGRGHLRGRIPGRELPVRPTARGDGHRVPGVRVSVHGDVPVQLPGRDQPGEAVAILEAAGRVPPVFLFGALYFLFIVITRIYRLASVFAAVPHV